MAFSTIQGSGGAPDSFVGTSGVDTVSLINSRGNFDLRALGANDVVSLISSGTDSGVVSSASARGGDGDDSFLSPSGIVLTLNGVLFNGNEGNDTLSFTGETVAGSSLLGGQGNDSINTGVAISSRVNGNIGNDVLTIDGASANSLFFGGQGNDTINVNFSATTSEISGDLGNDTITTAAVSVLGSTLSGGAGNDVINAATATSKVIANGDDGNDTITTGASADTINGGAGNDIITAGLGIDAITGGADQDTFVQSVSGLGAIATASVIAGTSWANSDTLTFGSGIDIVTDFSATDLLDTATANAAVNAFGTSAASVLTGSTNTFLQGTYNATTSVFTVGAAASNIDYLVAPSTLDATTFVNNTSLILLDNLGTTPLAANFV